MYVIHFDFQSVSLSPTRIDALKDVYIVGTNVATIIPNRDCDDREWGK
jgi:hypothetical protein